MNRTVFFRVGALALAFALALPLGLSLADGEASPTSPAALSDGNRGANGSYTGPIGMTAPANYEIATSADGPFGATAEYTPVEDGRGYAVYYLRATGAEPVFGPYYLPYAFDATAPEALDALCVAPDAMAQLVLRFSEPAAAVSGGTVRVQQEDGATYTATLTAGTPALRCALAANLFTDETGGAPALDPGMPYTATVDAGAFIDAAGNPCAMSAALSIPAAQDGSVRVLHNLGADMGWTLVAAADGGESTVDPGASVPVGMAVKAVATGEPVNPCAFTVYAGGKQVSDANLAAGWTLVAADAEIYARPAALSGTATLSGTAEYGQTLTASFAPNSGVAPSGLVYAWKRGGMTVAVGADAEAYPLTREDIGRTVLATITSPWCTGEAATSGVPVTKATVLAPEAPTFETQSDTSVVLAGVSGCEYRVNGGAWQASTAFSIVSGQAYAFEQRYQETETAKASPVSPALTLNTTAELTGTVTIEGDARVRSTVKVRVSDSNNTGALTYEWKRGAEKVSDTQDYTIRPEDANQKLTVAVSSTVETGALSASTGVVEKAAVAAPIAPTLAGSTSSSITLSTVNGCEYSLGGTSWQDATTFSNLAAGQSYTFYQRYKETDAAQASPVSAPGSFSTASAALSGNIRVEGDVRYGKTLVATFTGSGYTGTLNYLWYRGSVNVGTGQTYDVEAVDINNPIYVRVVSTGESGSVTQLVGVAKKAEYVGLAPNAPTRASRSSTKISLNALEGCEYSRGGSDWQTSAVFTGLKAGTSYKFYQRYRATATVEASPASEALTTSTSSGSSSGGSSSGGESTDDSGGSKTATPTPSGTALTSYTLSGDNTRILFSTMESLITGNKTQDVTIRAGSVEYTFTKGTMQLTPGTLWYDFGAKINGCAHQQAAEQAAEGHFVALVHYNMEGNLPAKARIRILLDAQQAGKTLYYYKLAPNTGALTFMQTALVDATGYATVEQSSCSDYVFLDAEIGAAVAVTPTPLPSETPQPTPSPTALVSEPEKTGGGLSGWLVLLVIAIALSMIAAGVVLFLRGRNERSELLDDDDFFIDDGYDDTFDANEYEDDPDSDGYDDADADEPEDDGYEDPDAYDGYDRDGRRRRR